MLRIKLKSGILNSNKLKLPKFHSDKRWSKQRKNCVRNLPSLNSKPVISKLVSEHLRKSQQSSKRSKNKLRSKLSNCRSNKTDSTSNENPSIEEPSKLKSKAKWTMKTQRRLASLRLTRREFVRSWIGCGKALMKRS